jgi:hypothetical protein
MKHGHIEFNTTTNAPIESGGLGFNAASNSLAYKPVTPNNDVTINIGFESVINIYNGTGSTILNGQALHINGSILVGSEYYANVTLATAAKSTDDEYVVGCVATHDIAVSAVGIGTSFGDIHDIDLSTFSIGDHVYLSDTTPGGYILYSNLGSTSRTCFLGTVLSNSATTGVLKLEIRSELPSTALTQLEASILSSNSASTGIFEWNTPWISIVDSTHFSIAPCKGWIIDNTTTPLEPTVTLVECAGVTNIVPAYLTTAISTYILVNTTGTVLYQSTFPTPVDRRDKIYLGRIVHPNLSTIQNVTSSPDIEISPMSQVRDMFSAIKFINNGIMVSARTTDLSIKTSAGSLFGLGFNWKNNEKSPSKSDISAYDPATFQYRTQTGVVATGNVTLLDVDNYDLNGTVTAISGTKATNQRVYMNTDGLIRIQYGQTTYSNLASALSNVQTEIFNTALTIAENLHLIGIIAVMSNATNLSNTAHAVFVPVSKFGENLGGAAGATTTTLQQAYNNSVTPEITTNATLGALTVKRGSASDSDTVLEVQNGAGNVTASIDGNGNITGNLLQLQSQNNVSLESTGFRYPELTVITANGDRTITLTGGASVEAYWRGNIVPSIVSGYTSPAHGTDTSKRYYLYYNGSTIAWYDAVWTFDQLQIAMAVYDATNAVWVYFRECHGLMPWQTHEEFHRTIGTYKVSGGTIPSASYVLSSTTAANRRPDIDSTVVADEDLKTTNSALTTETYTQYRLGASAASIFTTGATDIVSLSTNQPYYNSFSTPNWSQTLMPANSVATVWVYAMPMTADATSQTYRYLFVQPQWISQATSSSANAINNAIDVESARSSSELTITNIVDTEIIAIARIIIAYTGGNWTLRRVDLLTGSKFSQISAPNGDALSSVTTDDTLTGSGTSANPLKVNRTISRDWTTSSLIYNDEIVVDVATNYLYRATVEFTSDATSIQTDITAGRLVQVGGSTSSGSTGAETMQLGNGDTTHSVFDGSYTWIGIVIPLSTVTITTMKIWATQGATGTLTLGIYDSSYAKVAETATITNPTSGLVSGTLSSSYTLTKGTVYYFGIGGTINGLSVLGSTGLFSSNTPYISKEDINATSLPATYSGGSSTGRRFWIGAYA